MSLHTEPGGSDAIKEPRLWRDNGWTARVVKNHDDEGWAVEMVLDGQPEPALMGPWTMGRDKKNPKPLDTAAFNTLVKTAAEVVRRHEQHLQAVMHKEVRVMAAADADGEQLAQWRVVASFKLDASRARAWAEGGFLKP